MTNIWAGGGLILLLSWALVPVASFNLDVTSPVIKIGSPGSYFGFSVAQHRPLKNRDYGQSILLVGAPRDQNLQPQTNRSGALWSCPISSQWQVRWGNFGLIMYGYAPTAPPHIEDASFGKNSQLLLLVRCSGHIIDRRVRFGTPTCQSYTIYFMLLLTHWALFSVLRPVYSPHSDYVISGLHTSPRGRHEIGQEDHLWDLRRQH